ncbi:2-amino-4-hydroxy-6-hydroxymethyldihydropteridine diphosphokinase [Roseivirga sp. E12]|uniref:2-amino-4-hydroxy-6- hydroxymethyldihydropteridine diphosphokinase n=1 Tax=Roseivirga sp. E12 TaxID=2819237 RepID=UPI001ABC1F44|nr:2-amino-4-hydroxy-6-hydroxymethyldihydropteridine diphosphokinase [Roseivirga sp. E12]MBO3698669.1 2-amino-4-hydroxy-6-hydroxymethyldihydropteridine diphosphokinase [Roseivirga sp. E12]
MTGIYLLLGTNLGNKVKNLEKAIELMVANKIAIRRESSIYETAAWGIEDQPSFLNQVIEIETSKTPEKLLELLQGIEQKMGRVREIKWGERLIDIDILYYGDTILDHNDLKIPHPEIQNRRFTLAPLAEIAPSLVHPTLKENHTDLLQACPDSLEVSILEEVH